MTAIVNANRVVARLTEGRHETWNELVQWWTRFVHDVETGYAFTIYDYHNDLDIRGRIQDVLDQLSDEDRLVVEPEVAAADERFMAATREVDEVIATFDRGFWARRLPRKLVGQLADDLQSTPAED